MIETQTFCPIDYGFKWTDDGTPFGWYEFNYTAAHVLAKADRDNLAKELKQKGFRVKKYTEKQLVTKGGIGTNHPQIEELVTCFYVTWIY